MEIEYNLTEKDYIQFNVFHVSNTKIARRSLMINRIIGPILFILFGYFYAQMEGGFSPGVVATVLIASILWVVFYPKYFHFLVARNARKGLDNNSNQGLIGHHRITMNDDGVFDSTSLGTTSSKWKGIKAFEEDQHYIYLYHSATHAYIIPKRDIEQVDDVRNYIQSKRQS